jgi:hypothetical protein
MAENRFDAQPSGRACSNTFVVGDSQAGGTSGADAAENSDDARTGIPASAPLLRDRVTSSLEHLTDTTRWVGLDSAFSEESVQ